MSSGQNVFQQVLQGLCQAICKAIWAQIVELLAWGFCSFITFALLLALQVACTAYVLSVEPFHNVSGLHVLNVFYPQELLFALFDRKNTEPVWVVGMPEHLWPKDVTKLSVSEQIQRRRFWVSLAVMMYGGCLMLGTTVLWCAAAVNRHYEPLRNSDVLGSIPFVFFQSTLALLTGGAVIAHLTMVTKLVLNAAGSGGLSSVTGLDFEGYVSVLLYGLIWLLAQAVVLVLFRRRESFGKTAFAEALFTTTAVFFADPYDTLRDATFAGVALQSSKLPSKVIGWCSLTWLWAFHILRLLHADGRFDLQTSYLSVFMANPLSTVVTTADGKDPSRSLQQRILQQLFKQSTPERQKALRQEDLPQGLLAVAYSVVVGLNPWVLVSNILVPLLRYTLAWRFYGVLRKQVAGWLAEELSKACAASLVDKVRFYWRHVNAEVIVDTLVTTNGSATSVLLPADEGAEALKEALRSNRSTDTLDLSGKSLSVMVIQAVAEGLKENSSLRVLSVSDNAMGDEGAQALAEALKSNTSLLTLSVWKTDITNAGAEAMAEALKSNTSLQELWMGHNAIGEGGAQALVEALGQNTTLGQLALTKQGLSDAAVFDLSAHGGRVIWW